MLESPGRVPPSQPRSTLPPSHLSPTRTLRPHRTGGDLEIIFITKQNKTNILTYNEHHYFGGSLTEEVDEETELDLVRENLFTAFL